LGLLRSLQKAIICAPSALGGSKAVSKVWLIALFLFTLFLSEKGFGQSIVYERNSFKEYVLAAPRILKLSIGKSLVQLGNASPRLVYNWSQTATISQQSPTTYRLSVYLNPKQIAGSVRYRGMELSSLIWPDSIALTIALQGAKSGNVLSQTLTVPASQAEQGVQQNFSVGAPPGPFQLKTTISDVFYSQFKIEALEAATRRWYLYTTVSSDLAILPIQVKALQKEEDPDSIAAFKDKLQYLVRYADTLRAYQLRKTIPLDATDAATLSNLLVESSTNIVKAEAALAELSKSYQANVLAKANKLYRTARRERALPYYRKILAINPSSELAASRYIILLNDQKEYAQACRELCRNAALLQGYSHQRMADKAHQGLMRVAANPTTPYTQEAYRSLLDSVCKAYPSLRCSSIPNGAEQNPQAQSQKVNFQKLMNRARSQVSLNQMESALASAGQALSLAKEAELPHPAPSQAATLQSQIADRMISLNIYAAQTAYRTGKDSLGTQKLAFAKQLALQYRQNLPGLYADLLAKYAKPYLNTLAATPSNAPRALERRKEAGELLQALALTDAAFTKPPPPAPAKQASECRRAQADINEVVNKGIRYEQELNFIAAFIAYERAQSIRKKYPQCLIDGQFIAGKVASINEPYRFQLLMQRFNEHISEDRFDSALALYTLASKVYQDGNLASRFLVEPSLVPYYRNLRYLPFAVYYGERFLQYGELDSALALGGFMAEGKGSKQIVKSYLAMVGQALALRDKKSPKTKGANPTDLVRKYAPTKRFKELERAYLAAWAE
jgi:hypothetical protein